MQERNAAFVREDKAKLLVKHVVITVPGKSAMCPSFTDPRKMYTINIEEGSCDCPDNVHRGVNCMHMQAVDFRELEIKSEGKAVTPLEKIVDLEPKIEETIENKVLAKIFDDVGIEDTQGLIRKDLLLDPGTEQALVDWDQKIGKSEN